MNKDWIVAQQAAEIERLKAEVERLMAIINPISDRPCVWTLDNSFMDSDIWETDCGNTFIFEADGPRENGFRFCPYCRREICETVIDRNDDVEDDEDDL